MNHIIECPSCKQQYNVDESLFGNEVECAACHSVFVAQKKAPIKLELPKESSSEKSKSEENHFSANASKQSVKHQTIQNETIANEYQRDATFGNNNQSSIFEKPNLYPCELNENGNISSELAGPWRRWAARFIDLTFEAAICSFLFYFVLYLLFDIDIKHASSQQRVTLLIVFWVVDYFLAPASSFLLDSAIYGIFKGTFGKWLFGVRVVEETGALPSTCRYFSRNIGVLYGGFGLSIPFVNWIAAIMQYNLVSRGEPASYDYRLGFKSIKHGNSTNKTAVGILLIVLHFVFTLFLRASNIPL